MLTKEDKEYELPDNVKEALDSVRQVFEAYAVAHGDPLMDEDLIANDMMTYLNVWMIHTGKNHQFLASVARLNAEAITGLGG